MYNRTTPKSSGKGGWRGGWLMSAAKPITRSPGCGFSASKMGFRTFVLSFPHCMTLGCVGIAFSVANGLFSDDLGGFLS